jgi:cell division protein YceG involved in septum cleavage
VKADSDRRESGKEGIISNKIYFWLYLKSKDMTSKIYPGDYLLSGEMTIPEIAVIITNPEKVYEKILFKEGWTAKQMAEELKKHGFDGEAFLRLAEKPSQEIIDQFPVLSGRPKSRLEAFSHISIIFPAKPHRKES